MDEGWSVCSSSILIQAVNEISLFSRLLLIVGGVFLLVACSAAQPVPTPTPTLDAHLVQGKQLFSAHCASCHAIEAGTVIVGPSLFALTERLPQRQTDLTPEQYIEQSILQPSAYLVPGFDDLMPSNIGKRLSGEELDAIVGYVLSLQ